MIVTDEEDSNCTGQDTTLSILLLYLKCVVKEPSEIDVLLVRASIPARQISKYLVDLCRRRVVFYTYANPIPHGFEGALTLHETVCGGESLSLS